MQRNETGNGSSVVGSADFLAVANGRQVSAQVISPGTRSCRIAKRSRSDSGVLMCASGAWSTGVWIQRSRRGNAGRRRPNGPRLASPVSGRQVLVATSPSS